MAAKSDMPKANMSIATESATRKPKKLTSVPTAVSQGDDSKFDRLVYERVRLGIMSALAVRDDRRRFIDSPPSAKPPSIATLITSRP